MRLRDVVNRVRAFAEGAVGGWKTGGKAGAPAADEVFFDRKRAANPLTWWGLLPDPDLVLQKLGQDLTVYRELLTDAHVASCVQSRSAGVVCGEWRVEPGGPDRASRKAAEAAEAAEDAPRASMMAAPRLATCGMKVFSTQVWSTIWPAS